MTIYEQIFASNPRQSSNQRWGTSKCCRWRSSRPSSWAPTTEAPRRLVSARAGPLSMACARYPRSTPCPLRNVVGRVNAAWTVSLTFSGPRNWPIVWVKSSRELEIGELRSRSDRETLYIRTISLFP